MQVCLSPFLPSKSRKVYAHGGVQRAPAVLGSKIISLESAPKNCTMCWQAAKPERYLRIVQFQIKPMTDVNVTVMAWDCEVSVSSQNRSICAWGGFGS